MSTPDDQVPAEAADAGAEDLPAPETAGAQPERPQPWQRGTIA